MPVFLEIMRPIRTRRMSAVSPRRGQLSGAIPIALQVRKFRHAATRVTVSIGVAALVVAATTPTASADAPPAGSPCPGTTTDCVYVPPLDRVALVMGGTSIPTPDQNSIDIARIRLIEPTHPGENIEYVAVTAPMEFWPITGVVRIVAFALGPQEFFGLDGPAWPDEPLWKLSGLFDHTIDQSTQQGVEDLEDVMADHPNEALVIAGVSQGANVANLEKRRLAEQYPEGTDAPDIDFVLVGDPSVPNGGIQARFPGLYVPIGWTFTGPEPTDTQFDTVVVISQYDGFADFPLYPLNLISTGNAVLGMAYVHPYDLDASLAPDAPGPPPIHTEYGDTDYYFFPTENLPLFGPLRTLGVPEPVIDVVEPFFKVIVELGYDRSIPPGEPTPARLIPPLNPATVTADLVNATGEGINNAAALIGAPAPLSIPTPAATADQDAAIEQNFWGTGTTLQKVSHDVDGGVSRVLTAVGSQLPEPFAVSQDDPQASQRTVGRKPAATNDRIIGAVKSVIGNGRTIVRSDGSDNGSQTATASPARKTPVRDAVKTASSDINKVVTKVSDSVKKALSGGKDDDNKGDGGDGEAQ